MGLVLKDDGWRIPDEVWAQMEPLLPARPVHPLGCHNPRVPDRDAMNANPAHPAYRDAVERALGDQDLLLLLGLPALPGVGRGRCLSRVLAAGAARLRRSGRDRMGVAGAGRRARQGAPRGRQDRSQSHRQSKKGAKRSLLTEGQGVPLGIEPAGANLNDFKLARATLESIPIARPCPTPELPQGLCLDRGYDYPEGVRARGRVRLHCPHPLARRGGPGAQARRRLARSALGGRAHPLLASSLPSHPRLLGETRRHLSCDAPPRLWPHHLARSQLGRPPAASSS